MWSKHHYSSLQCHMIFRNHSNMQSKWITCSYTVASTTWGHHLSYCFRFRWRIARINKHIQKKRRRNEEEECVCSTDPDWREMPQSCASHQHLHMKNPPSYGAQSLWIFIKTGLLLPVFCLFSLDSLTLLSRVPVRCIQTSAPLMSLNRNKNELKWKDYVSFKKTFSPKN